jgi:hypothetical protein
VKAGHRSDMSDQPDKFGTTTEQVRWGSLEAGLSSLETDHESDNSGGGIGQVRYPSMESGKNGSGIR